LGSGVRSAVDSETCGNVDRVEVKSGDFRRIWRLKGSCARLENLRVLRYQSYKFELRPTGNQLQWMRRIAGCCRFVFNLALATQKQFAEKGVAELDFAGLSVRARSVAPTA